MAEKLEDKLKKLVAPSISLVDVNGINNREISLSLLEELSKNDHGVYLTINNSKEKLEILFKDKKIDLKKLHIIDAVSKMNKLDLIDGSNYTYIDHPSNITDMNLHLMNQMDKEKNKFLVIDSVPLLKLYNSEESIAKFLHFLSGANSGFKTNIILLNSKGVESEKLRKIIAQFCDNVIEV